MNVHEDADWLNGKERFMTIHVSCGGCAPQAVPVVFFEPTAALLQEVETLYERGLMLDALRRAESFAPFDRWGGAEACVLASRIAANTGASRLGTKLALRARRQAPEHQDAFIQYGYEVLRHRGHLAVWRYLQSGAGACCGLADGQRAERLALESLAAGGLRDFITAERLQDEAETLAPRKAWIRLTRAHLLEYADRVEEALEAADAARASHAYPFYRPAVQASAHLLQLLGRTDEAAALLAEADGTLQSAAVAEQQFALLCTCGRWREADAALARYEALAPLMGGRERKWMDAQRVRVCHRLGNRQQAAALASASDDTYLRSVAERLGGPEPSCECVQLDVPFVRQHFKTCAPATLAALGRYWGMPTEHLALAEEICYDGTPHWKQRRWAEEHGWLVREFRMTRETTVALLERNVPFAVSVVEATSAHMMAVVGFDRVYGTLLLRDPGQPQLAEAEAEAFIGRYEAFGPHGMVFLPRSESRRLDGLALPDAEIYDQHHEACLALDRHDREGAEAILGRLRRAHTRHALVDETALVIATYDENTEAQAAALDRLLERSPDCAVRLRMRLGCLREASREARLAFLAKACARKDADAALLVEQAQLLAGDARTLRAAWGSVERAFRRRPTGALAAGVLAELHWAEGERDAAVGYYRFAATLEGFAENLYQVWFNACRLTRRTEEALGHLRERFGRFGQFSGQPALTLAWALCETEQLTAAREVLLEGLRLRPEDGVLRLRLSVLCARLGDTAAAERAVAGAAGAVRENDGLRAKAEIADIALAAEEKVRCCRELLTLEPLALDAHAGLARALAAREGPAAALAHLEQVCAAFPHHCGLRRMLVEWSRGGALDDRERAVRGLLGLAPSDAWAKRELAMLLADSGRCEEAEGEAREAIRIDPFHTSGFSVLGHVVRAGGRSGDACGHFRRAIELSADNESAMRALLELAQTDSERKAALDFLHRQLEAQTVSGEGVLMYLGLARPVLDEEELLENIRQAHAARPDLWQTWSALVSQLGHMGRLDAALEVADAATERFAHLPRVWLDLAAVHRWRHEPAEEVAAASRAFELSPSWTPASLALADAFERQGCFDDALSACDRALLHVPADASLHARRATLLWSRGSTGDAFAAVERALRLALDFDWAWALLRFWSKAAGEPQRVEALARALADERPGEAAAWLQLARSLSGPGSAAERLAAVDKALAANPRDVVPWDLKAELLATEERFDEAEAVCAAGMEACPSEAFRMRGRLAWICAARRELPEAVRRMREVLADNAGYTWGWSQLAGWLRQSGRLDEAEEAAERSARLSPAETWSHLLLGSLRAQRGKLDEARRAYEAALRLDPTDLQAAYSVFDLQLSQGDLDGAAATVDGMKAHQPGSVARASEIVLRLARAKTARERRAALDILETLCGSVDPDPWPLDTAAGAFLRAGMAGAAVRVLARAARKGKTHPQTGSVAMRLLFDTGRTFKAFRLFLRLPPGETQRRAAAPLLWWLATKKRTTLLRVLLHGRRDVCAGDDDAWAQAGHALLATGQMKACARWLADWRGRGSVPPWALYNLCVALRSMGRFDESYRVAGYVVREWGHREGAGDLRIFLLIEDALRGRVPEASEHMRQVRPREDVVYERDILALAKAVLAFWDLPVAERSRRFGEVSRTVTPVFPLGRMFSMGRDLRGTFRRASRLFVREGGGWRARAWGFWRLNAQWILLPLAVVVVGPIVVLQPGMLGFAILFYWLTRHAQKH
jgi:tetratricopeptide (TPR) repeat protein